MSMLRMTLATLPIAMGEVNVSLFAANLFLLELLHCRRDLSLQETRPCAVQRRVRGLSAPVEGQLQIGALTNHSSRGRLA